MTIESPPDNEGEAHASSAAQQEVIASLSDPASWSPCPERVEHIETHGAHVFLAGNRALKIKRAVRYSYMDFSTLEKRRLACERETKINRQFAPQIYLGTVPVMRSPTGVLAIGGQGEAVEWAVSMRRFDQGSLLSRIARRGALTPQIAKSLADAVLASHRIAEPDRQANSVAALRGIVADVARFLIQGEDAETRQRAAQFRWLAEAEIEACAALLNRRRDLGFVRRCHGDLHLNNVVLIEGKPTLFDALEFDERLATIDTLYDLAFLLMDLRAVGQRAEANLLLGHYLWLSGSCVDLQGLRALPLFMALRAAIRAMVGLQRAALTKTGLAGGSEPLPRDYLTLAVCTLKVTQPRLIAIGGFSGTGKSTLAAALAPRMGTSIGALHLRSDLERKFHCRVGEIERLPANAYTAETNAAVYRRLQARTRTALDAGHSVIVDAVFSLAEERDAIAGIARDRGIAFDGVWLTATPETVTRRIGARKNDASDATAEVALTQIARGAGPVSWTSVDTNASQATVLERALALLQPEQPRA